MFRLRFKALASGVRLSDVLSLEETILPGIAFNSAMDNAPVGLRYNTVTTATGAPAGTVQLFEIGPNPFVQTTNVRFSLPEACQAQLRVLDASGRELWQLEKNYSSGYQQETIRLEGVTGALVCEMTTPWGVQSVQLVAVE
ncbi:MAG: hypothetical protein H6574_13895 [Lewinellaceae bacterium]|nr:hypothetical protein [Lewinellaceae bacterium]